MDKKILHWSYHNFREVPETLLDACDELEDLYMKENFITILPKWFFEVKSLRFLQLSGNLLGNLPDEVGFLENLNFLDVSKNNLFSLPASLGWLRNLERLYVNENPLQQLPEEVGFLVKLRILDSSKTMITHIPLTIARCFALEEINLNDNERLYELPPKMLMLPNLGYFYADRCNLFHLPHVVNTTSLKQLRVFENENLTHYPVTYEQYLPPMLHFSCPQKILFHPRSGLPQLCINDGVLNLPRTIDTLLNCTARNPSSLVELCLRYLHGGDTADDDDDDVVLNSLQLEPNTIPQTMYQKLLSGPMAYCGNGICGKPLFRECCFIVLRRFKTNQQYLFTQMFCSKDCTQLWTLHNIENYKCIWWS